MSPSSPGITRPIRALALLVACSLLIGTTAPHARASEEKETYPDGSLHSRVLLDSKGKRQGTYTAYFPGGKKVQERARYDAGQLNGVREVYDEKGNLASEQSWINGRLVFPKSPRMMQAARARIAQESAAYVYRQMKAPTNPKAPSADALARALAKIRTYRYLCDVPEDVTYDDGYINLCTYAGLLLDRVGKLSHDPPHPAGVDDEFFKLGHEGCGRSNLFSSPDIVASVDAYMNDSDPGNIDRVGHRRWVLNPAMAKTGFGAGAHFSAMYSFDGSRKDVPDYQFVAYPPAGLCPQDLFRASAAWHVTFNPRHYKVGTDVKAAVYPVDLSLRRAAQPLELNYHKVNLDGFGVPNAVIFRPKTIALRSDLLYEVVVTGLRERDGKDEKDGKSAEVSYFVSFF